MQTLLEFKPYLLVIFTSGTKLAGAQQATPASFFPCQGGNSYTYLSSFPHKDKTHQAGWETLLLAA